MPDIVRVAFILPGLHRVARGAEIAFESVGSELSKIPGFEVTLIGSGRERPATGYRVVHSPNIPRERFERWPRFPPLRSEYVWEEATFVSRLGRRYDPGSYDVVITCSYPFVNWLIRLRGLGRRPKNVFVTQNGDWPLQARNSEYRWFGCDALVCTNPVYFERHRHKWPSWLIPNGVDPVRFRNAAADRSSWGLRASDHVVVMVSALIPTKRVLEGIRAVASIPDVHLIVVGDGPLRQQVESEGRAALGPRFQRVSVPFDRMPSLYRSADAFLHMSIEEAFGNVYVEALAAGLPVVAHDSDSTRWLFEDQAILVDTRDLLKVRTALVEALRLQSPGDIALRQSVVARRFSWQAVAEEYSRCLRSVLLQPPRQSGHTVQRS
jgi:glycosyltransferase involved in cell wall biosynthesis